MDARTFTLGNAAGFIKGPGSLFDDLLRSPATDITVGSITLEPRSGNEGTVYQLLPDGTSVNALGMPNPGLARTLEEAPRMKARAREAGKRLRFSVAGFKPEEYGILASALFPFGDIELNLGCPNVWLADGDKQEQKPIASFDLAVMESILTIVEETLRKLEDDTQLFDVKVSPYSDPGLLKKVAWLVKGFWPRKLITCNTFPNGVADIATPGGFGGVGGNAMHAIALGQAKQFVAELTDIPIQVVGVGGIDSGARFLAMQKVGTTGAQVGTALGERGARIFSEILTEMVDLVEE